MSQPEQHVTATANALKCELAKDVLRSSGILRLQVTGWSMVPTLWPGDRLVIEQVDHSLISAGDIILFGRHRRLFAHRVVSDTRDAETGMCITMMTRGDGMPTPDAPVPPSEVLGRVSLVLRNGHCMEPDAKLGLLKSAVANIVRHSVWAFRVLVRLQGLRETSQEQVIPCQS
jgi:signal peptidase I